MSEKYGDNWNTNSEQPDDHQLFVESSGKRSHGRFYVVNSLLQTKDARETQKSQSSSSAGDTITGCRRRIYSDDEIMELLRKDLEETRAELEKSVAKKMKRELKKERKEMEKRMMRKVLAAAMKATKTGSQSTALPESSDDDNDDDDDDDDDDGDRDEGDVNLDDNVHVNLGE